MRKVRGAAVIALLGGAMAMVSFEACSSGTETTDGGTDGQANDTSQPDTSKPDAGTDAATDAPVEAAPPCTSTCGTPNCGTCPTTTMLSQHNGFANVTFKIDEHEVTNDEYAAFLAANVVTTAQPAACAFNTSFEPASWPSDAGANPVANVNWCDAYAYCAWAGKRLCGTISDGGVVAPVYRSNGDQSEWFSACTGHNAGTGPGGWQAYPYGNGFDAGACNGEGYGANATIPVKQAANCLGGIDGGLHDMSGNVAEWENSCVEQDGGPGTCALRGGAFNDDAGALQCAISATAARTQASATGGIRCCSN